MKSAKYMANVLTAANLIFGAMSIFLSLMGKFVPAAWMIIFSVIFDIADGKVARKTKGISEFGRQFDSLADLISFIVAPVILLFTLDRPEFFLWRILACLMVVFCGAFRLARFNIEARVEKNEFFNGLPTTGFGFICTSFILFYYHYNLRIEPRDISAATAILAVLMVSQVKYPTFKNITFWQWKYLAGSAIILVALFIVPELILLVFSLLYVIAAPIKVNLRKLPR